MSKMIDSLEKYPTVSAAPIYSGWSNVATALQLRLARRGFWRTALYAAGVFSLFVTILAVVQFATPSLAGNDGYYHIKMAYVMRTEGLKPAFGWLPLTVLNAQEFVDHHFLYHVLLIPFTFGDLRLGAKLASIIFPALSFMAVWWLLRSQKVPYPSLWSLGLLVVSEAFIYRMSMPRAQSLSLGVLVLALHWLLTDRHRLLIPLAFLYVWLYNAFPLILLVTGAYVAARWLVERRLEWHALLYAGLGVGLGLLVNPYFPDNLVFIARHVGPKMLDPTAVKVGNEWYPYKTTQLTDNSGFALIAFLVGVLALGLSGQRMGTGTATSLSVVILFGAMLFQSRRFVEYFPAFALIFSALAWAPLSSDWLDGKGTSAKAQWLPPRASARLWRWLPIRKGRSLVLAGLLTAILLAGLLLNLGPSRQSLAGSKPYQRYAGAAAWLQANTPQGTGVFQTDWDDFTRLFYYNTHNTYTLGLDPTYMQLHDAYLFELWVDISKGRVDHPSAAIANRFGASYAISDLNHESFLQQAADDSGLLEVYRDGDAVVFQVVQTNADNE
jgi:hypothetical protein